jgi:hypothetical protein
MDGAQLAAGEHGSFGKGTIHVPFHNFNFLTFVQPPQFSSFLTTRFIFPLPGPLLPGLSLRTLIQTTTT